MTNQTQKFWLETPLTKVENLIQNYRSWAKESDELFEMYEDDRKDFEKAVELFRSGDSEKLTKHVCYLDTAPREELVEAFYFDCGNDFVRDILGYEMSESWMAYNSQGAAA